MPSMSYDKTCKINDLSNWLPMKTQSNQSLEAENLSLENQETMQNE